MTASTQVPRDGARNGSGAAIAGAFAGALLLLAATVSGLGAAAAAEDPTPARAADRPVVVELFTSQGCASCPPADRFLGELARRRNIVALAFHVDYWDYIGWRDRFAIPEGTERQRAYARVFGNRFVYTPQMVVDGVKDASGVDRAAVSALIAEREKTAPRLSVTVTPLGGDEYAIEIPADEFEGTATVWLAIFDRKYTTRVSDGENSGRTLTDYNVVRELRRIGTWTGEATTIRIPLKPREQGGCAILVQADVRHLIGQGPILGAVWVPLDGGEG